MPRVILTSASYTSRSPIASEQRCINLYPEANPADAAAPMTFYGTPGRKLHSTIPGAGGVRCLFEASNKVVFAARGAQLYRYDAGTWVFVADLASSSGPVYAVDNGISAVFVDGTTTAPTVQLSSFATGVMSGEGWYGSDFVDYLNGFFIFNRPGTQTFYISGALDLTLDPLDFASAESVPDNLLRVIKDHNDLIMFGVKSTEVFSAGGDLFPFDRISGATMEVGIAAPHSACKMDNSVFWLGSDERGDATVWRMQGYQPQRKGNHALEEEMRTYERIDDAIGFSYQMSGHSWYQLTFPAAGKTWCFDAATEQWHERAYRKPDNSLDRVRDNCHLFTGRKHLVGDWENGNVYELDLDTYTDNGAPITRVKSFQHMSADNARQFFDKLTIDMEAGVGNASEPDPQVYLRWSDDGGKTWSTILSAAIGQVGEYRNKANFNRLGMGRDRVFEVSTAANAKIALQGAFIEARRGTS